MLAPVLTIPIRGWSSLDKTCGRVPPVMKHTQNNKEWVVQGKGTLVTQIILYLDSWDSPPQTTMHNSVSSFLSLQDMSCACYLVICDLFLQLPSMENLLDSGHFGKTEKTWSCPQLLTDTQHTCSVRCTRGGIQQEETLWRRHRGQEGLHRGKKVWTEV